MSFKLKRNESPGLAAEVPGNLFEIHVFGISDNWEMLERGGETEQLTTSRSLK